MERIRIGAAARRLGVHVDTVRRWADDGRIPCVMVAGQRRFKVSDIDTLADGERIDEGREALCVRVSGSSGQGSSLEAQEHELRETAGGTVVGVYKDRASGLRENRPGLARLLRDAGLGKFDVVRVTHEDRLARFGVMWITALLERDGVRVEVMHAKGSAGGMDELLSDFMSLVASFSGRMYGIRGQAQKARLLCAARDEINLTSEVADRA